MDEREQLPSASGFPRYAGCPGSWRMEKGRERKPSQWSERGDRIHAYLANDDEGAKGINAEEIEVAQALQDRRDEILRELQFGVHGMSTYVEQRLWYHGVEGEKLFSGKADYIAIDAQKPWALVCDWKTGFGDVPEADHNFQVMALAVLVRAHYEVEQVVVGIVTPEAYSLCAYDRSALYHAARKAVEIIAEISMPDAPLQPSPDACQYCSAASVCPALHDKAKQLATIGGTADTAEGVAEIVKEMPAETLADALERLVPFAKRATEAIEAEAKRRLKAGEIVPGWTLKDGKRESIVDVTTVYERCKAKGVPPVKFSAACKLPKKAVETMLRDVTRLKGKPLEYCLGEVLSGCTEMKETEPRLVAAKEKAISQ